MTSLSLPKTNAQRTVTAGLMVAVGLILPYFTSHAIGVSGGIFLPMHIPVLLAGLMCGPLFGALCGVIVPVLSSLLTGMPPAYPMLPLMLGELFTYGLVSGLLFDKTALKKLRFGVYPALVGAMAAGRLVYGLVFQLLLIQNAGLRAATVSAALVAGLPGIAVQLVLIPAIILSLNGAFKKRASQPIAEAAQMIRQGKASCVLIKRGEISRTTIGTGIAPLLALHDEGVLAGMTVADKIVGKAAAMIMADGGVKCVYALTISISAKEYLASKGIKAQYERAIDAISSRDGKGICPMERTVMNTEDAREGIAALREKMIELKSKSA